MAGVTTPGDDQGALRGRYQGYLEGRAPAKSRFVRFVPLTHVGPPQVAGSSRVASRERNRDQLGHFATLPGPLGALPALHDVRPLGGAGTSPSRTGATRPRR